MWIFILSFFLALFCFFAFFLDGDNKKDGAPEHDGAGDEDDPAGEGKFEYVTGNEKGYSQVRCGMVWCCYRTRHWFACLSARRRWL